MLYYRGILFRAYSETSFSLMLQAASERFWDKLLENLNADAYRMVVRTPPSALRAEPLVAEDSGLDK